MSSYAGDDVAMDGNVLAGVLGEVFGVDVTAAVVTCVDCSREQAVAELVVYEAGMGATARCRGCGAVVLRAVQIRSEVVLDLRGSRVVRIPIPAAEVTEPGAAEPETARASEAGEAGADA